MNVNSNGPNAPRPSDRYREAMDNFVQRTRTNLAHARHLASRLAEFRRDAAANEAPNTAGPPNGGRVRRDTVEISNLQPTEVGRDVTQDEIVRPKIARLKHLYRTGQLFKPENLERAAHALLQRRHDNPPNDVPNTGSGPSVPNAAPMASRPTKESGPAQPSADSLPMQPKVAPPEVKTFMKPTSIAFSVNVEAPDAPNSGDAPNTGGPNL